MVLCMVWALPKGSEAFGWLLTSISTWMSQGWAEVSPGMMLVELEPLVDEAVEFELTVGATARAT